MAPKYELKDVFSIINSGDETKIWFSVPRKSYEWVVQVYADTENSKTNSEAIEFIKLGILSLTEDNFVNQVTMYSDPTDIADEYGLIFDDKPWYIKLQITEGELNEISFHPPQKRLKTFSGKVIYE